MYITFKDVVGEKTIKLPGLVLGGKKVAIVEILMDSTICVNEGPLFIYHG